MGRRAQAGLVRTGTLGLMDQVRSIQPLETDDLYEIESVIGCVSTRLLGTAYAT